MNTNNKQHNVVNFNEHNVYCTCIHYSGKINQLSSVQYISDSQQRRRPMILVLTSLQQPGSFRFIMNNKTSVGITLASTVKHALSVVVSSLAPRSEWWMVLSPTCTVIRKQTRCAGVILTAKGTILPLATHYKQKFTQCMKTISLIKCRLN